MWAVPDLAIPLVPDEPIKRSSAELGSCCRYVCCNHLTILLIVSIIIILLRSGPAEADLLLSVPQWLPGAGCGGQWYLGHR